MTVEEHGETSRSDLIPAVRDRFLSFRKVYLDAAAKMLEQDVQAAVIAKRVWDDALAAVPLDPDELLLYKKLVAMHSVNGGELFPENTNFE